MKKLSEKYFKKLLDCDDILSKSEDSLIQSLKLMYIEFDSIKNQIKNCNSDEELNKLSNELELMINVCNNITNSIKCINKIKVSKLVRTTLD